MNFTYAIVHPLISVFTVALILTAFSAKTARRKRRAFHYITGLAAVTCAVIGISVAVWTVQQFVVASGGKFTPLPTLIPHAIIASLVMTALLAQATMGLLMYANDENVSRLLFWHRLSARLIVTLILGLILFGGLTVIRQFKDPVGQLFVVAAMITTISTAGTLLILNIRRTWIVHPTPAGTGQTQIKLRGNRGKAVCIHYLPDDIEVQTSPDKTILSTSLEAGIPHTHVCGGNARCSTCRVAVLEGLEFCQPRNVNERALAERLSFPPNIRLACQTLLTGDVNVRRLVLDDNDIKITSQINRGALPGSIGEEKHLAILFADIRGFTSFAEALPPYDVIHALNRYYQQMDQAIGMYGGNIDNYMGDGLVALFDGDQAVDVARRAVNAGLEMLKELEILRPYFETTYSKMLDIGIGLHYGQVVVGNLGSPRRKRVTVIGDSVNFASRIESANKEAGTHFLISDDTYEYVKDQIQIGKTIRVTVKGKTGEHTLYEVTGLAAGVQINREVVLSSL